MPRSAKVHDTLVYRLSQVLIKLNQGESLFPQTLADEFGVNLRTIQRDLNVRFASLPLIKSDGRYRLDAAHLGKLTLKDIENFAALSGVNGLFPKLSDGFLREVFDTPKSEAWLVRGHHYEDLRGIGTVFADLEQAIVEHHHVEFEYNKTPEQCKRYLHIEPYKLVNHKGIWYLAAWDTDRLKSFSITKLDAVRIESTVFVPRVELADEIAKSDSIWLGAGRQRVVLRVSARVAGYFERRDLLPKQLIEKHLMGGDLLVSTSVVHPDEILAIVRYWIPHVRILEPLEFQRQLESELADYLHPQIQK